MFSSPQSIVQQILAKPLKYQKPTNENDLTPTTERMPLLPWRVYSDRENNLTYRLPRSDQHYKTLGFLEGFYVVEEDGEFVRIVKDPNADLLQLSDSAENYGWISKRNLLLWESCLYANQGEIPRRAMIQNTVLLKNNIFQGDKEQNISLTSSPVETASKSVALTSLNEFFFVLKTDNHSVLVSNSEFINSQTSDTKAKDLPLTGWIHKNRLIMWEHRVALEPNWEEPAVLERRSGKKAILFVNEAAAANYIVGKTTHANEVWWNADPFEKRFTGEIRRFPVLRYSTTTPGVLVVMAPNSDPQYVNLMAEVYAPMRVKGQSESLFIRVLLLSQLELYQYIETMERLKVSLNKPERFLVEWSGILSRAGYHINMQQLQECTLSRFHEMIFSISPQRTPLKGVWLQQLLELSANGQILREQYRTMLAQKQEQLRKIANSENFEYSFRSHSIRYFWIEEGLMP